MNADESHITWRQETSQTDGQGQFMGEEQREGNTMIKKLLFKKSLHLWQFVLVEHTKQQQQNFPKAKEVSAQLIQLWCKTAPGFTG